MFLAAAAIIFAIYFANVAMGAFTGNVFLGDVGEMLVLFVASVVFVVAILKKETDRDAQSGEE